MSNKPERGSAIDELLAVGYAFFGCIDDASSTIQRLGRVRGVSYLEPKSTEDANNWSLSGGYGYERFPWHTDGAISVNSPPWLMLECLEDEARTRTELLKPDKNLVGLLRSTTLEMRNAIGRTRYLPAATPLGHGDFRLRWDIRVGIPSDASIADLIEGTEASAMANWFPGAVLIIDNFRTLHRRPTVQATAKRRLRRTYFGGLDVGL